MKKKLQLLSVAILLLLSVSVQANEVTRINNVNLNNPDVLKCLVESTENEGWKLAAVYLNSDDKLVYVFSKDNNDRIYTSN